MSGSQSGFVCWEGPAYTLTGARQVPGQGGVSCLAHFSSSPPTSLSICIPGDLRESPTLAQGGRLLSPSPPPSPSCCCSPSPGLCTRSRPWPLFRNQRGSFWLGQENQGPGRRGGQCRKPNTMTIYYGPGEEGRGAGKSLSLLPTPPPPPPPILGLISWSQ